MQLSIQIVVMVTIASQEKDKKHLAEFLEDYDDDKDDNRYYKLCRCGFNIF